MTLLSDAELAQIRAEALQMMPDTANILTQAYISDGGGGMTETYGTATSGVPCRLDTVRLRSGEQVAAGALQAFHQYVLTLPYDTTVTPTSRVEVNGQTFAVTSVDLAKSWAASRRVYVERI